MPRRRAKGPPNDGTDFSALYANNFDFVWRSIRAMGIGAGSVEDLAQEVFIAAGRKFGTFDRTRSERAWLLGITRNEVLQFRRSTARYARKLQAVAPPSPPPQPDELLRRAEGASQLETFLAGLEEPVRLSFVMAEFEGMRGREVAAALEIPLQTHYSRVKAARHQLELFANSLDQPRHQRGERHGSG